MHNETRSGSMNNFFSITHKNRIFGLDIMRFLSIFYVVYAHGYPLLKNKISPQVYNSIFIVDEAVTIFFVLSGFLIGKILIGIYWKEGLNLKNLFYFWIRRWFRTLPNYYLILLALLLRNLYQHHSRGDYSNRYLLFLQNFNNSIGGFFPESWSLATEEWFYLLLPISIFALSFVTKNKKQVLLFVILMFILLPLFIRLYKSLVLQNFHPQYYDLFYYPVICRLDSIMYGVLGAFFVFFYKDTWTKYRYHFIILSIAIRWGIRLIFEPVPYGFFAQTFAFSTEPLEILLFVPLMNSILKGRGFIYRMISFISIISYAMYVLNLSVISETILPYMERHQLLSQNEFINYLIYWVLTIGLSYLLYICYERPMMNLRDRKVQHRHVN